MKLRRQLGEKVSAGAPYSTPRLLHKGLPSLGRATVRADPEGEARRNQRAGEVAVTQVSSVLCVGSRLWKIQDPRRKVSV